MVTYGVAIDTLDLVKEICDIKQFYTQYGGAKYVRSFNTVHRNR